MTKIEPFEKYTERYEYWFEKNKYAYQSEIKAIKEILPDFKKGIEIGVGSGRFAKPLGIKFGIDPSNKMRNIAKSRGIAVFKGTAEDLPFDNNSYDLVLMVTTLCFLDDVDLSFKEVYRILKPDGFFINGFVDKESRIGKVYHKFKDKNVFYRGAVFFSVKEVLSYLKEAGFKNFMFKQTIFNTLDKIKKEEPVKDGFGEGSFVVIRVQK